MLHGIDEIDATLWNACANPGGDTPYNPFLQHCFLQALEDSGSATAKSGWQPFHIVLERDSAVLGVVPMYMKGHSQGEYVFDYAWADAWHRSGHDYYPKLQASIPFTPATGRRLLVAPDAPDNTENCCSALAPKWHKKPKYPAFTSLSCRRRSGATRGS